MMGRTRVLALAALLVLGACGGGGGGEGADCEPDGTTLSVTAKNVRFSTDCLAAPAGQSFQIEFTNEDSGVRHNVSIHEGEEHLFAGDIIAGPGSITYQVPALEEGEYTFRCDVHPNMEGTFVVG